MYNNIRLLCLDIDGTLLNSNNKLPLENRAAINWISEKGVKFSLVSARPPQAIVPIMEAVGVNGPIASFCGALITDNGKRLHDCQIDNDTVKLIAGEACLHNVHVSIYRDKEWFVSKNDEWSKNESDITGVYPTDAGVNNWDKGGAHKLLCMGEAAGISALANELKNAGLPVKMLRSKSEYLEIIPETAGKAEAVRILCGCLDIPLENVMAIGDHDTDSAMLKEAGLGVAMGNGSEKAKQAAKFITLSNDEAGVAYAIRNMAYIDSKIKE